MIPFTGVAGGILEVDCIIKYPEADPVKVALTELASTTPILKAVACETGSSQAGGV